MLEKKDEERERESKTIVREWEESQRQSKRDRASVAKADDIVVLEQPRMDRSPIQDKTVPQDRIHGRIVEQTTSLHVPQTTSKIAEAIQHVLHENSQARFVE